MFKGLEKWTNKRIRWTRRCAEALVLIIGYLIPLGVTVGLTLTKTESSAKLPLVAVIVCAFIISGFTRYFSKSVAKLSIYDNKSQTLKHCLELVGKLIIPASLIIACVIIGGWLKDQITLYITIVEVVLSCCCGSAVIDRLVVAFLDDETELREEAKRQNAVQARRGIVKGE